MIENTVVRFSLCCSTTLSEDFLHILIEFC